MAFHLYGFIAREATLRVAARPFKSARFRTLKFGMAILPVDAAFAAEVAGGKPPSGQGGPVSVEFVALTAPLQAWAARASERGPIAYVEVEFADGVGWQSAIVYSGGGPMIGAVHADKRGPVSEVLRLLGVTKRDAVDEFDALGLGDCGDL